jgi:hypothetical protein
MKKYGGLLAALVLLFAGCSNPVDGLLSYNDIYDLDEEEYIDRSGAAAGIVFDDMGLVGDTATKAVGAGAVAVTITFPATDGPWTAEFVSGPGSGHNALFDIQPVAAVGEEPPKAKLVIKEGSSLLYGPHSVRVKVRNESGLVFVKVFSFEVTLSPPLFKDAPGVYPFVVDGANKLTIRWPRRATATSYTVYVGKTNDFSAASPFTGTYTTGGTPDYRGWTESVEMTKFPDEQTALPDNTAYWVWVTATNSSGTTPPSPVAKKKTSLPIQSFFHDNKYDLDEDEHEGTPYFFMGNHDGDTYYFTDTTVEYRFGIGGYNYIGDVLYHETLDLGPNGENYPFPDKGKDNAICTGYPAGVFVIKYQEGHVPPALTQNDNTPGKQKRYGAVYYWGMGTTKPSTGRVESYIVNQWNGYAETVTLEEALDQFTAARVGTYVKMSPEPYYKDFGSTGE